MSTSTSVSASASVVPLKGAGIDLKTQESGIRTDILDQFANTSRFRSGTPKNFVVTPDGKTVYFLRSDPRSLVHVRLENSCVPFGGQ